MSHIWDMQPQTTPSPSSAHRAAPAPAPTAPSALPHLRAELNRQRALDRKRKIGRNIAATLAVVAAATILTSTLFLPVLQISGTSMAPTLTEGQVVVAARTSSFATGDVVAINMGSRILVKRIIAGPGDWVDITQDGTVFVNGAALNEPYITEKSLGKCTITLPYQVPEDSWFVLGDNREPSVDSRTASIGAISTADIEGKIFLRIYPLEQAGWL